MTYADLAAMPVAEKLQLMEALWESLSSDISNSSTVPAWHLTILEERAALLDQGQETVSAWGDAKQRIHSQIVKS